MTKGSTSYTWTRGRLLQSVGGTTFEYDFKGRRTKKGSTEYYYDGDRLITEKRGNNYLHFFYDESGVCGMRYNGENYEFLRNVLGDVVAIFDESGVCMAVYAYDAWGHCMVGANVDGIAELNPFRYRGYYYDSESGLYYLMSRYYDPQIGQFISPDTQDYLAPDTIGGVDLYAYCNNNPVMYVDPTGHVAISILIWIIVGAAVLTTAGAIAYGVIEEETIVLDLSYTTLDGGKYGGSLLLDFEGGNIEFYPHIGKTLGIGSGPTYSVGKVWNYDRPGSYAGPFVFAGGGYYIGVDGCFNPFDPTGASATSITFFAGISAYGGGDLYLHPISFNYKKWRFNKIGKED